MLFFTGISARLEAIVLLLPPIVITNDDYNNIKNKRFNLLCSDCVKLISHLFYWGGGSGFVYSKNLIMSINCNERIIRI